MLSPPPALQMRQGDHALSQLQGKHGCTAALSSLLGRVQEAALWRQAAALLAVLAATDDGIKEEVGGGTQCTGRAGRWVGHAHRERDQGGGRGTDNQKGEHSHTEEG